MNSFSLLTIFLLFPSSLIILIQKPAFSGEWCGGRGRSWQSQVSTAVAVDRWGNADFWKACKNHDECYWTLGSNRGVCDNNFKSQLYDACNRGYPSVFQVASGQREKCKVAGEAYAAAVRNAGSKSYKDAQNEAREAMDILLSMGVVDTPELRTKIAQQCTLNTFTNGKCKTNDIATSIAQSSGIRNINHGDTGLNEIYWWDGTTWKIMPGSAKDVGNGWVIGTDNLGGGNYGIYRWNGSGWVKTPGSGLRIGGNNSNPWLVNASNEIYWWDGTTWKIMPGSAKDVGDGWAIGTDNLGAGGYGIYRWNGSSWDKTPGSARGIGGNNSNPWLVN